MPEHGHEPLEGEELEEFERNWERGLYQRALREQLASGETKLVDQETGDPVDVDPDSVEFVRDGQNVHIRATPHGESGPRDLTGIGFKPRVLPTPGQRGFLWPEVKIPTPRRCPRCRHWIPTDEHPGEYMGAMSRVRVGTGRNGYASRSIEICSSCGEDEGMGRGVIPIEDWPI